MSDDAASCRRRHTCCCDGVISRRLTKTNTLFSIYRHLLGQKSRSHCGRVSTDLHLYRGLLEEEEECACCCLDRTPHYTHTQHSETLCTTQPPTLKPLIHSIDDREEERHHRFTTDLDTAAAAAAGEEKCNTGSNLFDATRHLRDLYLAETSFVEAHFNGLGNNFNHLLPAAAPNHYLDTEGRKAKMPRHRPRRH